MDHQNTWIFTFGIHHKHSGKFVRITGTWDSAREEMIHRYSDAWGFQYPSEEAAGIEKYNLKEIK